MSGCITYKNLFMKYLLIALLSVILLFSECNSVKHEFPVIPFTSPIDIDGIASEDVWKNQEWKQLDQVWLGNAPDSADFMGKYKFAWDNQFLYVLAEIQDDTLIDINPDPLVKYWDDDCLEVFIDENASGGNHQYSYNAFAYHIALDGNVADIAPDSSKILLNHHARVVKITNGNTTTWEVAFQLYDDTFKNDGNDKPLTLQEGKNIGFMLAYCDNDRSPERENFVGSVVVEGTDKNRGWIDAGIFGKFTLGK